MEDDRARWGAPQPDAQDAYRAEVGLAPEALADHDLALIAARGLTLAFSAETGHYQLTHQDGSVAAAGMTPDVYEAIYRCAQSLREGWCFAPGEIPAADLPGYFVGRRRLPRRGTWPGKEHA